MPAPYSEDLRQKAIEAVKRGERKKDVSEMFNISRNTLDLWLHRVEQTGNCRAIVNYQQGCKHKITDWESDVASKNEGTFTPYQPLRYIYPAH